jgi:uncharacterized protein YcbX
MIEIGTVAAINRFPVKSMQGEAMKGVGLHWTGVDGDRQYAFYRVANRSRFPWLTARDVADLVRYVPRYADGANPRSSAVQVTAPDGESYDIAAAALAARLSTEAGEEVRLLQVGRGVFDSMPVSVITTGTGRLMAERFGRALDLRRFRSNIVIAADGVGEESWLGAALQFGAGADSARLRLNHRIGRCVVPTIDPESAVKDAAILRLLVEEFGNEIGAYGAVEARGTLTVGDPVYLAR